MTYAPPCGRRRALRPGPGGQATQLLLLPLQSAVAVQPALVSAARRPLWLLLLQLVAVLEEALRRAKRELHTTSGSNSGRQLFALAECRSGASDRGAKSVMVNPCLKTTTKARTSSRRSTSGCSRVLATGAAVPGATSEDGPSMGRRRAANAASTLMKRQLQGIAQSTQLSFGPWSAMPRLKTGLRLSVITSSRSSAS